VLLQEALLDILSFSPCAAVLTILYNIHASI
jgi:hypothetical protein